MDYYAVYIPSKVSKEKPEGSSDNHVFKSLDKALKAVSGDKEGRFKRFQSYDEALEFSAHGVDHSFFSNDSSLGGGEKSLFRTPSSQELVLFRKSIESANVELVKSTAWQNPRYLISAGDTPSILKEGTRYNALHVAALSKSPDMCKTIIDIVSDTNFIKMLHGKDNIDILKEVSSILLDLYLNTPEKGRNETPLHLAVKYGYVEVVEQLTSYPQCKMLRNLEGRYPKEIICARATSAPPATIDKITMLLKGRFYVPMYRAKDNCVPPKIGEIISTLNVALDYQDTFNPSYPTMKISAYAGPMEKKQSEIFRKRWKNPPRQTNLRTPRQVALTSHWLNNNASTPIKSTKAEDSFEGTPVRTTADDHPFRMIRSPTETRRDLFGAFREQSPVHSPKSRANLSFNDSEDELNVSFHERNAKLSDPGKGLEKIGRLLADQFEVEWNEYWEFLKDFANIRTDDGLRKLETHLKCNQMKMTNSSATDSLCAALTNVNLNEHDVRLRTDRNGNSDGGSRCTMPKPSFGGRNNVQQPAVPNTHQCVEKSCQTFATRIAKTIQNNADHILQVYDDINSELSRLQSLISSYKTDERFVDVDFGAVHSRTAHWIVAHVNANKLNNDATIEKLKYICQSIINCVSPPKLLPSKVGSGGGDVKISSVQCLFDNILKQIDCVDRSSVLEQITTESKCVRVWHETVKCNCEWALVKVNGKHFKNRRHRNKLMDNNAMSLLNTNDMPSTNNNVNDNNNFNCYRTTSADVLEDSFKMHATAAVDSDDDNNDGDDNDDDEYVTALQSPASSDYEDADVYKNFIQHITPTRIDYDVYNAICDISVSQAVFPCIYDWKRALIELINQSQMIA